MGAGDAFPAYNYRFVLHRRGKPEIVIYNWDMQLGYTIGIYNWDRVALQIHRGKPVIGNLPPYSTTVAEKRYKQRTNIPL